MRRRSIGSAIVLYAVASATGCSLLVSFDDRGDAACNGGACGGTDATTSAESGGASSSPDGAGGADSAAVGDAGDCSLLSEGETCAKADACRAPSTCHAGVCTANPLTDGTMCGMAPDACHLPPACKAGVCAAAAAAADGTACGAAPDACHLAPQCASGTCGAPGNAKDGTKCGVAPDACHDAPTCRGGACQKPAAVADGVVPKGGDAHARCCGGSAVETTTNANCGVCGWTCGAGQTCAPMDGEYLCTGCTADSQCRSNCCSTAPAPNHCSPSNCSGACQANVCPDGSHCVTGTVDYCTY